MVALQTFTILNTSYTPNRLLVGGAIGFVWTTGVLIAVLCPTFLKAWNGAHTFYAWNGYANAFNSTVGSVPVTTAEAQTVVLGRSRA